MAVYFYSKTSLDLIKEKMIKVFIFSDSETFLMMKKMMIIVSESKTSVSQGK